MNHEVLSKLGALNERHKVLSGFFADRKMADSVGAYLAGAIKTQTYLADQLDLAPAKREEKATRMLSAVCGLVDKARRGHDESMVQLNALRVTTIDNYVRATSAWLMFFRRVDLPDNESPSFKHTYRNEITVFYRGQDGGTRRQKSTRTQRYVPVDLKVLQSEKVEYPTRDIYEGLNIADAARAQFDIGFDLSNKVSSELFALIDTSAFGAFVTTGNRLLRTFHFNSAVNTANIPTTNILTLSGNTASTKFRSAAVQALSNYFDSFAGATVDPIGTTGLIMIPSSEVNDLSSEFLPTGQSFNSVSDAVIQMPKKLNWMGNWTLQPDVTLAKGTAYPVPTLPVGEVYFKPSMDRSRTERTEDPDMESQSADKVIGMAIPEPWRIRMTKVIYHS